MINWYSFNPVDTLFFKGAEPMMMGENHTVSSTFPPPPHTIAGALRTTILKQHGVSFDDYGRGHAATEVLEAIGKAGESSPFEVIGPLLMRNEVLYLPAPFSWFAPKDDLEKNERPVSVYNGAPIKTGLIKSGAVRMLWACGEKGELASIGGHWIRLQDLRSKTDSMEILGPDHFFATEPRTGIALHKNRRVRHGHLYTFNHARLQHNVLLVFGIDQQVPLKENGILSLGGEQRFGAYRRLPDVSMEMNGGSQYFMTLSLVEKSDRSNNAVMAAGKIQYIGGWDLNRGFHKPMKGFFPAGTVFSEKINSNCIPL